MSFLTKFCFFGVTCAFFQTANGESRIVNGTDAAQGEFPYAVSLRFNSNHTCGATILDEWHILTAAHCVCDNNHPRNVSAYSIQFGLIEITRQPVNVIDLEEIYCHEYDSEKLVYDCAVLKLKTSLPDDQTWQPVTLSSNFTANQSTEGVIIGWGMTGENEPVSTKLQKLQVEIYDDDTCSVSFDKMHHICFGAMTGGACYGDSGTALLVKGEQVGIASFITNKCGLATKETPNVYSRVATYYQWIVSKMEDSSNEVLRN